MTEKLPEWVELLRPKSVAEVERAREHARRLRINQHWRWAPLNAREEPSIVQKNQGFVIDATGVVQ